MYPTPPTAQTGRPNSFGRQLGFWALHCGFTALPSFLIAVQYFKTPSAIIAMLAGVLSFVLAYSLITSTPFYGKIHHGLIGRSVKLGATIRMVISLCSLPVVLYAISPGNGFREGNFNGDSEVVLWAPDFWFGYLAIIIISLLYNILDQANFGRALENSETPDFFFTYATTITEGVLISLSLLVIAFVALVILSFRRNRRQLPSAHFETFPQPTPPPMTRPDSDSPQPPTS